MIVDEVLNDDDDDDAACLVRTNFCHGVHFLPGFCFLSPPWDSGMPNFHLLAATASVSLDITPERKGTDGRSL